MRHFLKITEGVDVAPILAQLDAQPELWDAHPFRTASPLKTFKETSDIWVRFRAPEELTEPSRFAEPHFASWYPAWYALPALRPVVFALMATINAAHLGGILITRIPLGGKIAPHHDRGGWHAEFYQAKIYVPLRTNDRCVNRCEDEAVVMGVGEAWWFDNLVTHSVENDGETERMTLIACYRVE